LTSKGIPVTGEISICEGINLSEARTSLQEAGFEVYVYEELSLRMRSSDERFNQDKEEAEEFWFVKKVQIIPYIVLPNT